jgi:hypothetical protein
MSEIGLPTSRPWASSRSSSIRGLKNAPPNASDEELRQQFANLREPLPRLSMCPDLVVNRGGYFGTTEFYMIAGRLTSGASVRIHSSARSKMNISKGR